MNEVEKFKKNRQDNKDQKKETKRFVRNSYDMMQHSLGDPYALNRMHNNRYRDYAEDNKVTGLKSLIHELELRWMATPGLGGKPEGPSVPPTNPIGLNYILELLNNKSKELLNNKSKNK